jgi:hypothetical protein
VVQLVGGHDALGFAGLGVEAVDGLDSVHDGFL